LKIVLDINVYISAAILGRVCEEIIQTCRFSDLKVFISKDIIDEIKNKLSHKFLWQDEQISLFLDSITEFCQIVEVEEKVNHIKNDPDDERILECAISADCDFIISGDNHLLKLKSYEGIKILNPADFLLTIRD